MSTSAGFFIPEMRTLKAEGIVRQHVSPRCFGELRIEGRDAPQRLHKSSAAQHLVRLRTRFGSGVGAFTP
jgi:hypothetical protein